MAGPDITSMGDDLRGGAELLEGLVSSLGDRARRTATPAPGWTVLDQVTHLAFFDDQSVLALQQPDQFRRDRAAVLDDIDRFTEAVASAHRDLSVPAALAWFRESRAALAHAVEGSASIGRVPWYGPDMSVASVASARLMETWAHTQDVLDALGVVEHSTIGLRHVAHLSVRAWANGFTAHGLPVPPEPVFVSLTPPDGSTWQWGSSDCQNQITGSAVDFCLVATQRRHPADTDICAQGDVAATWLQVAQAYAGPPGPKRTQGQFPSGRPSRGAGH